VPSKDWISRQAHDGTVEVWVDGWHVTFPPGEKPTAHQHPPPEGTVPGDEGPAPQAFGGGHAVKHDGWIVVLTASKHTIVPVEPDETDDGVVYRQYYRG
jgi:hypothetical protein